MAGRITSEQEGPPITLDGCDGVALATADDGAVLAFDFRPLAYQLTASATTDDPAPAFTDTPGRCRADEEHMRLHPPTLPQVFDKAAVLRKMGERLGTLSPAAEAAAAMAAATVTKQVPSAVVLAALDESRVTRRRG